MSIIQKFRDFKQKRFEKAVQSHLKTLKNSKAIREDRSAAIEFFKVQKDPKVAIPALLARFEFSLEHGIADTREKESCMEGIMAFQDKAVPYLLDHVRTAVNIAWPIKALLSLSGPDVVAEALLGCLDYNDVAFDRSKTDKNYDILCYLMDYKLGARAKPIGHFLSSSDERVRFAATEVLLEQGDLGMASAVETFLLDQSEDNIRIKQMIAEVYHRNGWSVQNRGILEQATEIPGYVLNGTGRFESA